MPELNISPDLTIEDIHKIREYHYELTKDMSREERRAFYRKGAEEGLARIEQIRKEKALAKAE